uniref:Protein kinase domain-containing protein n=1 Tax=Heterorhabditis bacteriophora TaxID=37862 RepID=A0A1I7XJT0_HETBA
MSTDDDLFVTTLKMCNQSVILAFVPSIEKKNILSIYHIQLFLFVLATYSDRAAREHVGHFSFPKDTDVNIEELRLGICYFFCKLGFNTPALSFAPPLLPIYCHWIHHHCQSFDQAAKANEIISLVDKIWKEDIAAENGQNPNERIPFKDQTWKGTKSRTRDATLSRYTGVDASNLSKSHSGELWRGKWQGNDIVARILAVPEVTPRISRDFQTEFPALRIFAHTNICPVLAAANQPPNLVVISQYMPFGSLYNVLHEQSSVVIDHSQAIRFAVDIARGIYYLSSKHVVVDEELTAKLSMADTKFSFQEVGRLYSPAWMSPEDYPYSGKDVSMSQMKP